MTNDLVILVDMLKAKQGDMTNLAFARSLGVSRQLWEIIKAGRHKPGTKFIGAVMSKYPDLILEVINYMRTRQECVAK